MNRLYESVLLTDLYQLTMLQGYYQQGMTDTAVFEFFCRELPDGRNFLVAAGLEQVLDYLEGLHFSKAEIDYLKGTELFAADFLNSLQNLTFTGDVHAMPEGTLFFSDEPILRITAPIAEAQLVESRVINLLHLQTLLASKAVRMRLAAPDKILVDFGLRRAHGAEAGLLAARASYIAGFAGSSTVAAGRFYDIPIYGTMAHSFIQAHENEIDAFRHFAKAQPGNVVLLIDTYDTLNAAQKIVELAPVLAAEDIAIKAVRLDSGDLAELSRQVRSIFDHAGLEEIKIFTSGNLDEYELARFKEEEAPIDGFGIGTKLDTSADAPYLDCAYKLEEYAGIARRKRSEGKQTWPGRKQVYRSLDRHGMMDHDQLGLCDENLPGTPLLHQVMKQGKRLSTSPPVSAIRKHLDEELLLLPERMTSLDKTAPYKVRVSNALRQLADSIDARNG